MAQSTSYPGLKSLAGDVEAQRADIIRRFQTDHPGLTEDPTDPASVDLVTYEPPAGTFLCIQQEEVTDEEAAAKRGYQAKPADEGWEGVYQWGFLWNDAETEQAA